MSHIDPATGTNPFFTAAGYTPGNQVIEKGLGAEQPVAAVEELLASATVHVPQLVAQGKDVQVTVWLMAAHAHMRHLSVYTDYAGEMLLPRNSSEDVFTV